MVEETLSDVEGVVGAVFDEIDQSGAPPSAGSDNRTALVIYLALQITRTPEQRERTLFPERLAEFPEGPRAHGGGGRPIPPRRPPRIPAERVGGPGRLRLRANGTS